MSSDDGAGAPTDGIDLPRIERAIRELLLAIGEDPDRDGLARTPARVAEMYREIAGGLHEQQALLHEYHEVSHALEHSDAPELLDRLSSLQSQLEDSGGWRAPW